MRISVRTAVTPMDYPPRLRIGKRRTLLESGKRKEAHRDYAFNLDAEFRVSHHYNTVVGKWNFFITAKLHCLKSLLVLVQNSHSSQEAFHVLPHGTRNKR